MITRLREPKSSRFYERMVQFGICAAAVALIFTLGEGSSDDARTAARSGDVVVSKALARAMPEHFEQNRFVDVGDKWRWDEPSQGTEAAAKPAAQGGDDDLHQVSASRLNMRSQAGTAARVVATYPTGTMVKVLAKDGKWTRVEIVSDGRTGWMFGKYLSPAQLDMAGGGTETVLR